jgi:AcrR family transcriptional regulator
VSEPSSPTQVKPVRTPGVQIGEFQARMLILEGAARTFMDRGLRATSVEDLLGAAGVSRRTFYRLYTSKEDVAMALYRFGTERLLDACTTAVSEERDLLRQLERCIDAHLANAGEFGRLIFVLGGEAQRHESVLHARRMEVHEKLVALLADNARARTTAEIDPLLFRGLVLAIEGMTRVILAEGDDGRAVSQESIDRVRRVTKQIAAGILLGAGAVDPPDPGIVGDA